VRARRPGSGPRGYIGVVLDLKGRGCWSGQSAGTGVVVVRTRSGRLLLAVAVLGVVLLALTGCTGDGSDVTLTMEDDGSSVRLRRGSTLTVELESNPSTGYSWAVITQPAILSSTGEPEYIEPESADGVVGAPGTERFEFRGANAGTDVLEFEYARSWETTAPPEDTFKVTVTVF